jgi:poly-gamma-glutamate synthesis protein (capsule biosynthesis protein)
LKKIGLEFKFDLLINMKNKILFLVIGILAVVMISSWVSYFTGLDGSSLNIGEPKGNVSIAIAGDVMFGRKMPGVLDSVSSPFMNVENVTKNVDLLLINFENPTTLSDVVHKGTVPLKAHPGYTHLAKANENTIAALANNHIFDYGEIGLNDTLKSLKENGILFMGAGNNKGEATKPVVKEINGRKIVVLNYMDQDNFKEYSQGEMPQATVPGSSNNSNTSNAGYSAIDWDVVKKDIEDNDDADIVIVYLHFGNEYSRSPNEHQQEISKKFIDYGADIVTGSHAHVTQGVEIYKDKAIFYGLGNFIFDQSNPDTHRGMFLELNLIDNECEITVHPVYINNYIPEFMGPSSGKELLSELSPNDSAMNITDDGKGKVVFSLD